MKPKHLSLFPNLPRRKSTFLFGPGEQILDQIETICSQQDKFRNTIKLFWFRFQNHIRTFVLSFLTFLERRAGARAQTLAKEKRFWSIRCSAEPRASHARTGDQLDVQRKRRAGQRGMGKEAWIGSGAPLARAKRRARVSAAQSTRVYLFLQLIKKPWYSRSFLCLLLLQIFMLGISVFGCISISI